MEVEFVLLGWRQQPQVDGADGASLFKITSQERRQSRPLPLAAKQNRRKEGREEGRKESPLLVGRGSIGSFARNGLASWR